MQRFLCVGDPHATADELDDCEALADLILKTLEPGGFAGVIFLGDLHHNHTVVHIDVQDFWRRTFRRIWAERAVRSIVLKGNHDEASTATTLAGPNALQAYLNEPGVQVVDRPMVLHSIGFVPYCGTHELFLEAVNSLNTYGEVHTLVCHQTFDGSRFENGFYTVDGIDPALVPQERIISGHIHEPQEFSKVWYLGAPRHRTRSDANSPRNLWVLDFDAEGRFAKGHPVSTFPACREIRTTTINPNTPAPSFEGYPIVYDPGALGPQACPPNVIWHVDLYETGKELAALRMMFDTGGYRVRCFDTAVPVADVRESTGVEVAFRDWLRTYKAARGTPAEVLLRTAEQRMGWAST